MMKTLLIFLCCLVLCVASGHTWAEAPPAEAAPAIANNTVTPPSDDNNNNTFHECLGGCNADEVCLTCSDGSAACFPLSMKGFSCCGCNPDANRCTACPTAASCLNDNSNYSGYACKSPMMTLIILGILGGCVVLIMILVISAFLWHRRRLRLMAEQPVPSEIAPLLVRQDSTIAIVPSGGPEAAVSHPADLSINSKPTTK